MKNNNKNLITLFVVILCCITTLISVGFSALNQNLNISGDIEYEYNSKLLYDVLRKEAQLGTYVKEYTGEHQDSMDSTKSTEKIYHWYAPSTSVGNNLATEILDKNNVIFANHCWQMIRTTDTGGVKIVYNGEPENGKCLDTRNNHVGYESETRQSMSTTYYYGTSYTYNSTTNVFSLGGTITSGTIKTGQYTCKSTSSTGTCSTLYLVDKQSTGTTYYVLPLNSNSHYSQIGKMQFEEDNKSPASVGYMHNKLYTVTGMAPTYQVQFSNKTLDTSYYYSSTIDYGNQHAGNYTLISPALISTLSDYSVLVGKYILNNTGTYGNTACYVVSVNGTTVYYKLLTAGDLNITINLGDSYTDNGNGTYTIDNPVAITYLDWYEGTYNGQNKYICFGSSPTCTDIKHVPKTAKVYNTYWGSNHKYKYSESVSYSGGTYTLTGDIKELWDIPLTTTQTTIKTHHYTCLNSSTTCTTVSYVCYYSSSFGLYHVQLTNIANVEDLLVDMLSSNDVNQTDSTVKTVIDAWYKKYMTGYTNQLEDTIFCNDRVITNIGGWNPSGGNITASLQFKNNSSNTDLSCTNITDKFSISNTKAKLTYPVGLLTYPETNLLNHNTIRKTGEYYWHISPYSFNNQAFVRYINSSGSVGTGSITNGVRPVVSLKPGTEYTSGTGSKDDPYVVE